MAASVMDMMMQLAKQEPCTKNKILFAISSFV